VDAHAEEIALSATLFCPQHQMSPEMRRAQVWSRPAATATASTKFCVQLLQAVEEVQDVEQALVAQTFTGVFLVQIAL
jgi:hypothetical protein